MDEDLDKDWFIKQLIASSLRIVQRPDWAVNASSKEAAWEVLRRLRAHIRLVDNAKTE
jgi:hypothetical protein